MPAATLIVVLPQELEGGLRLWPIHLSFNPSGYTNLCAALGDSEHPDHHRVWEVILKHSQGVVAEVLAQNPSGSTD